MISSSLIESLKHHEGLRLQSYKDSEGIWTIGYGRNLQAMQITQELAVTWLYEDAETAEEGARTISEYHGLNYARQNVIIEMTYNLGLAGVKKFKKMLAAIQSKDYDRAADEMLDSTWRRQVGVRADRLADIMRRGEYQHTHVL